MTYNQKRTIATAVLKNVLNKYIKVVAIPVTGSVEEVAKSAPVHSVIPLPNEAFPVKSKFKKKVTFADKVEHFADDSDGTDDCGEDISTIE